MLKPQWDVEQIGEFTVQAEIARGGMGVVYRVLDPHGQPRALKLMQGLDSENRQRFEREVLAMVRLRHPHIVRVYGAGRHCGHPFMVMDLVEGSTLESRLREGPLDPREVAVLGRKIADALHHAHEHDILHRDVKPDNVLLDQDGEPRLIDFGLAKQIDSASPLSQTGFFMGTPGFWPPEQAAGLVGDFGPHSDVYALGATLYALLTGQTPLLRASVAANVRATLWEPPTPPRKLRPEVDDRLQTIVLTCMRKEIPSRYPSAAALSQALQEYLESRSSAGSLLLGFVRSHPTLLAALLLAGAVAATWARVRDDSPGPATATVSPRPTASRTPTASPQPTTSASVVPPGARAAYAEGLRLISAGKGITAMNKEDLRSAEGLFSRAIELAPEFPDAYVKRGHVRLRLDEQYSALQDYERAVALQPNYAEAMGNRAYAKLALLDEQGAEEDFQRMSALSPRNSIDYLFRGQVHRGRGETDRAVRDFEKAIELDTQNLQALFDFADFYLQLNRRDDAERVFTLAIEVRPSHFRGHYGRGLARRAKDPRAALADFTAALERSPGNLKIIRTRGDLNYDIREYLAASVDYDEILRKNPDDPHVLNLRGTCRFNLDDDVGAIADFRRVVGMTEHPPGSHGMLGSSLWDLGRDEEAIAAYEDGLRHHGDNFHDYFHRGLVYAMQGRRAKALADMRQAAELDRGKNAIPAISGAWVAWLGGGEEILHGAAQGEGWYPDLARFLIDEITAEQLLASAISSAKGEPRVEAENICEAHCYIAMTLETRGDLEGARAGYRACLATAVTWWLEYSWAKRRLAHLEEVASKAGKQ